MSFAGAIRVIIGVMTIPRSIASIPAFIGDLKYSSTALSNFMPPILHINEARDIPIPRTKFIHTAHLGTRFI